MIQGRPGQSGAAFVGPHDAATRRRPGFSVIFSADAAKNARNLWPNPEKTVILAVLQILFLAILVVPSGFPLVIH